MSRQSGVGGLWFITAWNPDGTQASFADGMIAVEADRHNPWGAFDDYEAAYHPMGYSEHAERFTELGCGVGSRHTP